MLRNTWSTTFAVTGLNVALTAVSSILLARGLGPENRGVLLAIMFWPAFLLSIFYISLNEATAYHIARAGSESHQRERQRSVAMTCQLLMAVAVTLTMLLILPLVVSERGSSFLTVVLMYASVFSPFTILYLFYSAVRQGQSDFLVFNLLRLCQPLIYVVGIVVLALFGNLGIETALQTMLISTAVSVLLAIHLGGVQWPTWDWGAMRSLFRTALRLHGVNVLLFVALEVDKLIVIEWMDDRSAGLYVVALAVSTLGSGLVVNSLGALSLPKIAGTVDAADRIRKLCQFTQAGVLSLVLVNVAGAVILPPLLPLIFGANFGESAAVLVILLVANTLRGLRQVIDRNLRAMGENRPSIQSEVAGLLGLLALAPIGVTFGGLSGIAWGVTGSQLLALAVMVMQTARAYQLSVVDFLGMRLSIMRQLVDRAVQQLRLPP
jgi:O-antigen/teichoic acid export membrane protein